MKTIKKTLTLAILLLLTININSQTENIGKEHNVILGSLLKNKTAIESLNGDKPDIIFKEISKQIILTESNINIKDLDKAISLIKLSLNEVDLFTTKIKITDVKKIFNKSLSKRTLSKNTKKYFDLLFLSYSTKDQKNYLSALENIKNLKPTNDFEKEFVNIFLDVYNQSNIFWNNYQTTSNNQQKVSGFWRQQGSVIADAAGGAAGFAVAGPFGGYFLAAYTSFAVGNLLWNI